MKKNLINLFFVLVLASTPMAFCEESNIESELQTMRMPTDAEIMETINKFNFDKSQQEYLFKETKKRLQDVYTNQNFSAVLQGSSTLKDNSAETKAKATANTKKYAGHSDLTKKSD